MQVLLLAVYILWPKNEYRRIRSCLYWFKRQTFPRWYQLRLYSRDQMPPCHPSQICYKAQMTCCVLLALERPYRLQPCFEGRIGVVPVRKQYGVMGRTVNFGVRMTSVQVPASSALCSLEGGLLCFHCLICKVGIIYCLQRIVWGLNECVWCLVSKGRDSVLADIVIFIVAVVITVRDSLQSWSSTEQGWGPCPEQPSLTTC